MRHAFRGGPLLISVLGMSCASGTSQDSTAGRARTEDYADGGSLADREQTSEPSDPSGTGANGLIGGSLDGAISVDDGAALSPDAPCAAETRKAEPTPLDMMIMMDRSGSMGDPVDAGGVKWDMLLSALTSFVEDSSSLGLGVGIQYFGLPVGIDDGGDEIASCTILDYAKPDVPIGTLPGGAAAVVNSLRGRTPAGGTPTVPALAGAIQYARSWAGQNPTHKVIVVLATDGEPNDCDSTVQGVTDLAAAGLSGGPPIPTYVIGVGALLTSLDQVAAAGGTDKAFIVDTSQDVAKTFLQAMNTIRNAAALPCRYAVPPARGGTTRDLEKLNVAYTAGSGASAGQRAAILKASGASQCDPISGGWYYDDPVNPTSIELCDATCHAVTNDPGAEVEILVGCKALVIPIR
jgi:von Willebrand factor type A domain